MLYKNDEPYKLAPNDVKTLIDKFKRFPLAVIYPPERIVKSRSPQNRLPDKPNSISFPLSAVVKTKTGAEHWRYAENVIIKEHGVKKYTPKNLRFNGRMLLQETDMELAWFLYTKSIYCKEGLNHSGKTFKFMFEDLISDAEKKADLESVRSQVKALIYGNEFGLSEDKLRALAKAYFVKNVDMLSFAQVKIAIEHAIGRDARHGLEKFIEMTHMDELIKTRARMQNLMDAGKLKYDLAKKEWQWAEDGKKIELICKVAPGTNPNDVLYDYYMGNKDFQEVVESVEKSKKVKVT
jgi:hypothetical protein